MERIIDKARLGEWIAALENTAGWEAYAPTQEDGVWAYKRAVADASLDHPNTAQPPKGFAFPQREIFFKFEQIKGEAPRLTAVPPAPTFRVVFGVRPCDGRAVERMDRVFTDHVEDGYYTARRQNLAYVGLACNTPPSRHCFCKSVGGSPVSTDGLDVLLTDLGERYHAIAITDTGNALMEAAGSLLVKPDAAERKEAKRLHAEAVEQPQRGVHDAAAAPEKLKAGFDSPLWDSLAQACIGCGICTFLCPTCHCFDINDEVTGTVPLKGSRVRTWDTCQFPDFTMHSSGHNPRDTLGSRLRQRVSHKFRYFHENFGMHQCTGCGRCVSQCPVGIDIVHVVNQIAGSV